MLIRSCISVVLLFLSFTNARLNQEWVDIELSKQCKLSFPSKPELANSGNRKVYQFIAEDYLMIASVTDLSNNPDFNIEPSDLGKFYEGIIDGALAAANNAELLSKQTIKNGAIEGKEIIYTKDFNGVEDLKVRSQVYLIEKTIVFVEFWELTENDTSSMADKFFSSLKITE